MKRFRFLPDETQRRVGVVLLAAWVVLTGGVAKADSVPTIHLSPTVGPPSIRVTVSGRHFQPLEGVTIDFDTLLVASVTASGAGGIRVRIKVPSTALPGAHVVMATGLQSGESGSAPFLVRTDWTKFHFDPAATGANLFENVVGRANAGRLGVKWAAAFGQYVNSSPAIASGRVFIGTPGPGLAEADIWALDASTGSVLWKQVTEGLFTSSPTVWGGSLFVGTLYDHMVRAFDAATGALQWAFTGAGAMNSPVVIDGRLYVAANSGIVYSLDPKTGAELWEASTGPGILAETVAISNGLVLVGSESAVSDPTFFAFDATTGATRWSVTLNQIAASATVANGVVYVGSEDHNLYALDADTGVTRWIASTGDGVDSSPAVASGEVYAGSLDGNLYAFDALSGSVRWKVSLGGHGGEPIVANGVVYVAAATPTTYALDAKTGAVLWSFTAGDQFGDAEAISDGVLYAGSFDGNLYAFDLSG